MHYISENEAIAFMSSEAEKSQFCSQSKLYAAGTSLLGFEINVTFNVGF